MLTDKLNCILNVLNQSGLNASQDSISIGIIGAAHDYSIFEMEIIRNFVYINTHLHGFVKNPVASYPEGLPTPRYVHMHFEPDDLSSGVVNALKEKDSTIILPDEVSGGHIGHPKQSRSDLIKEFKPPDYRFWSVQYFSKNQAKDLMRV